MSEFDITSLLSWQPMQAVCINCRALHADLLVFGGRDELRCPNCGVTLQPASNTADHPLAPFQRYNIELWLEEPHGRVRPSLDNMLPELLALARDAQNLARAASDPRPRPPLYQWLFRLLDRAQLFVHVSSFATISPRFLNALAFGALRVPVYGIVGQPEPQTARRLATLNHIMPAFAIRPWAGRGPSPHHKLIIIDGIVALVSSANLTDSGWAKIPLGRESLQVVTQPAEVVRLNNSLFAPCWAAMSPLGRDEVFDLEEFPQEPPAVGDELDEETL
jgi:hypothetical protein